MCALRLTAFTLFITLSCIARAQTPEPHPTKAPLAAENPKYLDVSAPLDDRVADLVARMTLEEKALSLDHRGPNIERIGLRSDKWNQCLHGVWWDQPSTMFPVSIAMAATWNTGLIHEVATAISDEARAINNGWREDPNFPGENKGLIYRAPVINISRNPYWGRINETYSEDPYLTGRMAVAFVKGLQGDVPKYLKLASTLKHYAVNNVERGRQGLDVTVSPRMMREYWLPHFRDAVVEGGAQSLMASYNSLNGTPNNINKWLLTDVLKNEWQHEGFVVSDLGGVNTMVRQHFGEQMTFVDAVAQSLIAGCDFSDREFRENIPAAVREGKLPEERLNDAVRRVMRVRMRLGEFDPPANQPYCQIPPSVICSPKHRELALKTAREAIVLLENRNNLLPLDKSAVKSIAVIGPHSNIFTAGGYSGIAKDPVTPLMGIQSRAPGTNIVHAVGGEIAPPRGRRGRGRRANAPPPQPMNYEEELRKAVEAAKAAEVAIVYVGTSLDVEHEGRDRTSLTLPGNQQQLVEAVIAANPRTVVVLMSAGPLTTPWLKANAPAMLQAWWLGEEGGNAIADVIFGETNPAGRLPYTVYASEEQVPPQDEYDISKGFTYMYVKGEPQYPFGHGLSYTKFNYANFRIASNQIVATGTATISVDIKNTGPRSGDEVAQLYVRAASSKISPRPKHELRGFDRISLAPGETKTVTFTVPAEKLVYWDEAQNKFVVEPGDYEFQVGASSADIRAAGRVDIRPATP
jgi:beta-glucosidase